MGFFSRTPKERSWEEICSELSRLLEGSRQRFFQATVQALEKSGRATPNTTLGGSGDLALKAYQLELVSDFIGKLAYVEEENLHDFDSLLLSQIGGDETEECMAYLHRYYVQQGEANVKLLGDLIRYITGEEETDIAIVVDLRVRELMFSSDAQIVTAIAFGDGRVAGQLSSKCKSAFAKLNEC